MKNVFGKLSILTMVIAAVAFGMFLASGLNIIDFANGDDGEDSGPIYVESTNGNPVSFAKLAKIANPAVVNITATTKGKETPRRSNDLFDYFFGRGGENPNAPVRGFGSGFVISKDGYILTNYHVVSNLRSEVADDIRIKLYDGDIYKATVVGTDSLFDVALIKIDTKRELPFLKLGDSDAMEVGEWVMAIGNPSLLDHTVTVGVVSAQGRQLSGAVYRKFIQTDAAINQGNSGGPLLNLKGEAIGINAMIIAGTEGIGFAIPINQIKEIIPQLKSKGYVQRGYIGILPEEITLDLKKSLSLSTDKGIFVQSVTRGGAAEKAGIEDGDLIVSFDGKDIESLEDLYKIVGNSAPGKETNIVIIRNGKKQTIKITPDERPSDEMKVRRGDNKDDRINENLGIAVAPISVREKRYYRIPEEINGVLISKVNRYSPADDAGLQEDMIIRRVNRKDISSVKEFYNELEDALDNSNVVAFYISFYSRESGSWESQYVTVNVAQ
ncbi:MAG: Do family serine endopeptidase [Acidobacteria bacterium]|nr:Do family serine endopeptidase [Acidobacteriota bacterium]